MTDYGKAIVLNFSQIYDEIRLYLRHTPSVDTASLVHKLMQVFFTFLSCAFP
jgi:hypothetical protein